MNPTSLIPTSRFPLNAPRIRFKAQISTPSTAPVSQLRTTELQEPPKNPKTETTNDRFPTMTDIISASTAQNLDIELKTLGPLFRITARSLDARQELGRAEGLIRVWTGGKILHLDSIRLRRETLGMERSIFGIGLFIGAVAIRHGYECGCRRAELLAINDSELYHSKLVRFYTRIGFEAVHEVTGSTMGDIAHMLVWGGVGTRMNANIEDLLIKWCTRFKSQK
ncbi:hypothetical protein EUGRSUZ_I01062 [Eucalyptus grandis]|uniref:N-acetyltransferase domain-containing protein n=2 Tax=Eucalyptus grandis TaxID=71139 RepID=A0A059AMM7_EUCGR|nr:hypothetical protein EUGRSUZ_I01062 [Eucalyptus grandis]